MEMAWILARQILQMFLLAGLGYALFKGKKITPEGSRALGNILIYLALPAVIINGFRVERTQAHILGMVYSGAAAAVLLLLSIVISRLFFKKDPIAAFAASFSNPGFFGVPLIVSSLSSGAVFYVAAFIAFLNLLQWTYGVAIMTGEKKGLKPVAVLKAPFMIAILIGLFFFLTGIKMPAMAGSLVSTIAALNTPLAMFTVGIYLAQTDLLKMVRRLKLYGISAVRLILIPLLAMAVLSLMPASLMDMKLAILIAAACPVGSNVAVYAQLHGKDYGYAVETVVISTLFFPLDHAAAGVGVHAHWGIRENKKRSFDAAALRSG